MTFTLEQAQARDLLERFGIHMSSEREFAGMPAAIEGRYEPSLGGHGIALTINGHTATRMWPLGQMQAEAMIDELQQRGLGLPHDLAFRKMVSHLLMKFSRLQGYAGLEHFVAAPLYLGRRDYRLENVRLEAPKDEFLRPRSPRRRFTDARQYVQRSSTPRT